MNRTRKHGRQRGDGELLKIDPDIEAIVSSGYFNDPIMTNFREYGFKGVVAELYTLGELTYAIRNVMDDPPVKGCPLDPLAVLGKYYAPGTLAHRVLVAHSRMVAEKALIIAQRVRHLHPDEQFIREAAMLHDIGILFTNEPQIGCFGSREYLCHGFLGRELLEKEGLPKHALVCERHVGTGITLQEIEAGNLPVPRRDMTPVSLEEKLICFADKFFSKNPEYLLKEKPVELVRKGIARYGEEKLRTFDQWVRIFGA